MMDGIFGLVIILALLGFGIATFVTFIVWLFLKDRARFIAGNILMIFSLCLAFALFLPQVLPWSTATRARMGIKPERTVEVVAVSMKEASDSIYAQELSPGLKAMSMFNYPLLSPEVTFHTCAEALKKEISKHPDTPILTLSLAALEQRDSTKFSVSHLSSAEQAVVAWIKIDGKIGNSDADESLGRDLEDGNDSEARAISRAAGENLGAPTGWFLDELKSKILGGDVAKAVEEKRRKNAERMVPKLWATSVIQLLLTAIGGGLMFRVIFERKPFDKNFGTVLGINFTARTCLAMLLVGLYCSLAISAPLGLLQASLPSYFPPELYSSAMNFGADLAILIGFLLCIYFWLLKPNGTTFAKAFDLTTTVAEIPQRFAQGFTGFAILIFLSAVITVVQVYFTKVFETSNPIVLDILVSLERQNYLQVVLNGAMVSILAPVIEELFFRGMLYRWLRQRLKLTPSLIISSAVFAMFHFDPAQLPGLMAGGIVFALVYERTKSLLASMICHSLANSLFLILTVIVR
jgi:membrane protease YdiL (CAAX protease family)